MPLRGIYSKAYSMGNKEEEFEDCVQLQGYNLIGIMQKWRDSSRKWSAAMEEYRLFRKESRKARRGVALYVTE